MEEKVSIIIPAHNAAGFIEETVRSIFEQTYTNFEIIICENGSTDNTRDIISSFEDSRIKVLFLENNLHAAGARNAGVRAAEGEYVAYLDADDLWAKDKLEKQIAFMKKTGAAFSFTGYEFGDADANPLGKIVRVPETLSYEKALRNTTIFTSTVCFDLRKLTKDEIMMPDIKSEDTALWWQILRKGVTAYGLDENLVIYRRPAHSLSSNKFEAIKRIWFLYRKWEKLNIFKSAFCFAGWAFRAVKRRV